jgi:hypothetical protein
MVNIGTYPLALGNMMKVSQWMLLPLFEYYREECCTPDEFTVTWTDTGGGVGNAFIAFANMLPLVVGANPFDIHITFNNMDATGLLTVTISTETCGDVKIGVLYTIQAAP